jgi:hypothetical protein
LSSGSSSEFGRPKGDFGGAGGGHWESRPLRLGPNGFCPKPSAASAPRSNWGCEGVVVRGQSRTVTRLNRPAPVRCDVDARQDVQDVSVFVASHHGRESGCCTELFELLRPQLVIISDDKRQYDNQRI